MNIKESLVNEPKDKKHLVLKQSQPSILSMQLVQEYDSAAGQPVQVNESDEKKQDGRKLPDA